MNSEKLFIFHYQLFISAMHLSDQKSQLRQSIEQRLKSMSTKDLEAESRSICRRILEHLPKDATVCAYVALKTEVNLTMLIDECMKNGQKIYLPCFIGDALGFREFTGWDNLIKGQLGIREPLHDSAVMTADEADIVLVPGRAFDREGKRLGRGNGGYDLWIQDQKQKNPNTQYWGVAYEYQIVNDIPMEAHDQGMDAVVTPREFIERK